ncbi:MAG TPA: hypothetical protein V6C71_23920 [Coleofasciculaceae cyanobacterium]|jgi:hypothetical protein
MFDEAQELLSLEVSKFQQNAEQWANNLLNTERPELNIAYRFTAPVFKQHISQERVARIVNVSSRDRNLFLEQKQEKYDDIEVEFQMSYASQLDLGWIYQQVAIAEYLDTFSELSAKLETLQDFAFLCQKIGVKSSLELLSSKQEEAIWYTLPC